MSDHETPPPEASGETLETGRCHWCGEDLSGKPLEGECPTCESPFDEESAHRLQPWPSPFWITLRLIWPVLGVLLTVPSLFGSTGGENSLIVGYLFLLSLPINSIIQVRMILKRSLPEEKRTQGPIAVLRYLGIALCIFLLLSLLAPLILFGACLILLNGL